MRTATTVTLAALALATPIAVIAVPAPVTTAQGVYTEDQAADGAKLYAGQCSMCHGKQLEGTLENPALTGGRFVGNWAHGPVGALADYIHRAMPQMAPGTLSPESTAKIVAYLLQRNGYPVGKTALPTESEALGKILIEPPKR